MPTVLHRLARWAEADPQSTAQRFKRNGQWQSITAKEYMDRVYWLALFLESRGLRAGGGGCIFSPNNPQWVHLDLATLLLGARSAGIYPNSIDREVSYVLDHAEATVLSVANREFYEKILGPKKEFKVPERVHTVIALDNDTSFHPNAIAYESALNEGRRLAQSASARRLVDLLAGLKPQEGAFMIYTSGTTGNPKGALVSHDNLVFTSDLVAKYWKLPYGRGSLFSFLPLCHIAEKLQSVGVGICQRYVVNYCTKFELVSQELPEVQPSLLLCVPRLWEKMMESVLHKVNSAKGPKKELAIWAFGVGERVAQAKYSGKTPNPLDLIQLAVADKLVLGKVRSAMGLAHAETLASGAAALPSHVSKWFRALSLEILEDYGQTESTGVICMTERGVESAGTVGRPVPGGTEFKLASDGEILARGRHVFVGYYKNQAATDEALQDGWLHTGDLGELTPEGLVRIRGRKKEILKTSGGKMIAPAPIEDALKAAPIISQVCMVGDNRKFVSAIITLSEAKLAELKASKFEALDSVTITDPDTIAEVRKYVDELNKTLSNYEQIKKFSILSREFSIADGEMTPTLKMKRSVVEQRYASVIDGMYA